MLALPFKTSLFCSHPGHHRWFRKGFCSSLLYSVNALSPLLPSLICTAQVMLAAAPDPTLFSALSFSPCLAADISTHFCATNDDTSDIQALPRDLALPSAIALLFLIPERQHALHHLYTGRLSIAPELLNSSTQAVSACSRQSAENSNDLTAGHFAHLLVETACSYDYTSQSSLPRLQTHLLLLQHLKTTLTTASNLHHSLLSPSSSPAGMRSLSFMVASLFVSALTLSSASTQIHSYIFKLKKLPDPLTPLFAAATTITAKEDLSLVYEFKRFSESSFGLQLSPLNLRCRSCRIPAFLHC
ncbi:hypothetical protein D6C89_10338 [Aureobasidium pullulans]|nr:hypothetical protein D6C89_10338 [Aureobasidium pullulans]